MSLTHTFVILIISASAFAGNNECNQAISSVANIHSKCENLWPLGNIQNIDTLVPPFCSDDGNCTQAAVEAVGKSLIQDCTNLAIGINTKKFLMAIIAQSRLTCLSNSNGEYCLPSLVSLYQEVFKYFGDIGKGSAIDVSALSTLLGDNCDPECVNKSFVAGRAIGRHLKSGLAVPLMAPAFACMKIDGEYCFVKLLELIIKAKTGVVDPDLAKLFCSPCVSRVFKMLKIIHGLPGIPVMPVYKEMCYRDDGELCLEKVMILVKELDLVSVCTNGFSDTACRLKAAEFVEKAGCCARAIIPIVYQHSPTIAVALAKNLPAECKPGRALRVIIKLALRNILWSKLKEKWAHVKALLEEELADILGLDKGDINALFDDSSKRANPGVTFEVSPSTTAVAADDIESLVNSEVASGNLQFSALNEDLELLEDPTQPIEVEAGTATVEDSNGASSIVASAMAVVVAALAISI